MKKEQPTPTIHTEQHGSERLEFDDRSNSTLGSEVDKQDENSHQTNEQETDQASPINIYQPQ